MSTAADLNRFLADVEKRAYAMTLLNVKNREDALDIVQDAMLMLASKYAGKPVEQWPPLFYRILRNRTTDFHRRAGLRRRWFGLRSTNGRDTDDDQVLIDAAPAPEYDGPERALQLAGLQDNLTEALGQLPDRQRQAFMLRAWEGLDVKQTGLAMGCSQGSVKTHYSRAVHSLRNMLESSGNV